MKNIKIILIVLLTLPFLSVCAQLNNNSMFGTWESEIINSNQIFRVSFFPTDPNSLIEFQGAEVQGHFRLVEVDGSGNETIIYTSNKQIWEGDDNYWWPPAIHALVCNSSSEAYSIICDNNVLGDTFSEDCLTLTYISSFPLKVQWKITRCPGLQNPDRFVQIPTDLVLTKTD